MRPDNRPSTPKKRTTNRLGGRDDQPETEGQYNQRAALAACYERPRELPRMPGDRIGLRVRVAADQQRNWLGINEDGSRLGGVRAGPGP